MIYNAAIQFTKMQSLGNDFMVIDATDQDVNVSADNIRAWANRKRGIGFDQLLMLYPPSDESLDFNYVVYNADGSLAKQCGNGARCIALFIYHHKLRPGNVWRLGLNDRVITLTFHHDRDIMVDMGEPVLTPADVPFQALAYEPSYQLNVSGISIPISVVSMGNPHAIYFVSDVERSPIDSLGPAIATHRRFPDGVNVSFAQCVSPTRALLKVYERGVGKTDACGSGACATVVAGRLCGMLGNEVVVSQPGGDVSVRWAGQGNPLFLAGTAHIVFVGQMS